jgi:hypothetical protein
MANRKKRAASNARRFDPYKNFNFRILFSSVASGGTKALRTLKASIDAAFTRRLR